MWNTGVDAMPKGRSRSGIFAAARFGMKFGRFAAPFNLLFRGLTNSYDMIIIWI